MTSYISASTELDNFTDEQLAQLYELHQVPSSLVNIYLIELVILAYSNNAIKGIFKRMILLHKLDMFR